MAPGRQGSLSSHFQSRGIVSPWEEQMASHSYPPDLEVWVSPTPSTQSTLIRWKLYPRHGRPIILGPGHPNPSSPVGWRLCSWRGKTKTPEVTTMLRVVPVEQGYGTKRSGPLSPTPAPKQWCRSAAQWGQQAIRTETRAPSISLKSLTLLATEGEKVQNKRHFDRQ